MLPDLEGVAFVAPDFDALGVGATAGVVSGTGAGVVAGVDEGGELVGRVVPLETGVTGAPFVAGGVSGFLKGSTQVCRT